MKKYQNKNVWRVLSFMLFVLAVVSGGGAMAMPTVVNDAPIGDEGPSPKDTNNPGNEIANPNNNDLHIPGDGILGRFFVGISNEIKVALAKPFFYEEPPITLHCTSCLTQGQASELDGEARTYRW